jgi:alkylhydroperoxidase/carboxymuconolactone decarboxylase family protein YurZ
MAEDSYEEGMKIRRKMLGDAWVDRSLANRNDFNAEIQQQITRQAWGEVWTRPGIHPKTRRFMAMSIMIALRAWDEFRLHVRTGLTQVTSARTSSRRSLSRRRLIVAHPRATTQRSRKWQTRGWVGRGARPVIRPDMVFNHLGNA